MSSSGSSCLSVSEVSFVGSDCTVCLRQGNIGFKTTKEEVERHFEEALGKLTSPEARA